MYVTIRLRVPKSFLEEDGDEDISHVMDEVHDAIAESAAGVLECGKKRDKTDVRSISSVGMRKFGTVEVSR